MIDVAGNLCGPDGTERLMTRLPPLCKKMRWPATALRKMRSLRKPRPTWSPRSRRRLGDTARMHAGVHLTWVVLQLDGCRPYKRLGRSSRIRHLGAFGTAEEVLAAVEGRICITAWSEIDDTAPAPSPMPPGITNGPTSKPLAPAKAHSAEPSPTGTCRSRCCHRIPPNWSPPTCLEQRSTTASAGSGSLARYVLVAGSSRTSNSAPPSPAAARWATTLTRYRSRWSRNPRAWPRGRPPRPRS